MENISANKSFGGWHKQYIHHSKTVNGPMQFAVYLPPACDEGKKVPVLYWLSGLTCNDENFMQKACAQRIASELGIAIVAPDTSPRGDNVANDEAYDLGQGAGFYVNATENPWAAHYQMYDYIVDELPALIKEHFPVNDNWAISGHSMGGHGALMIGLRNSERFTSISAFSPIVNPVNVPWGQKAFSAYLGDDQSQWQAYDSCVLMEQAESIKPILISQGLADNFLETQLKPWALQGIAIDKGFDVKVEQHVSYDHSYYFIASFIERHLRFHAQYLFA